jgi:hypothetical protein
VMAGAIVYGLETSIFNFTMVIGRRRRKAGIEQRCQSVRERLVYTLKGEWRLSKITYLE